MSIASEITRIKTNISNAYAALEAIGAAMPASQNSDNLKDAINTITVTSSSVGTIDSVSAKSTHNIDGGFNTMTDSIAAEPYTEE